MSYDYLKQAIYLEHLSTGALVLLLGVAFVLGALHALSPGHGKSLMAAYLVGTSGRLRDVLILGTTITLSHVFSVVVLGLIALWLEDFFLPGSVSLYFSLGSGILILLIGVYLLISRWRAYRRVGRESASNGNIETILPGHSHSSIEGNTTAHVHSHAPGHSHESEHSHSHTHHHFDRRLSLWQNIVLGVSGGIVPCPKALVILLLAISLQKIVLGLAIIGVFSLGLAAVLIALGIVVIRSGNLLEQRISDRRILFLPVLGAVVIIALGGWLVWQTLGQF